MLLQTNATHCITETWQRKEGKPYNVFYSVEKLGGTVIKSVELCRLLLVWSLALPALSVAHNAQGVYQPIDFGSLDNNYGIALE